MFLHDSLSSVRVRKTLTHTNCQTSIIFHRLISYMITFKISIVSTTVYVIRQDWSSVFSVCDKHQALLLCCSGTSSSSLPWVREAFRVLHPRQTERPFPFTYLFLQWSDSPSSSVSEEGSWLHVMFLISHASVGADRRSCVSTCLLAGRGVPTYGDDLTHGSVQFGFAPTWGKWIQILLVLWSIDGSLMAYFPCGRRITGHLFLSFLLLMSSHGTYFFSNLKELCNMMTVQFNLLIDLTSVRWLFLIK